MKPLLTLIATLCISHAILADEPKSIFELPVRLMSEGKPINEREQLLFPSPVLMDIDGDREMKLVIGDLWGKLRVYRQVGKRGDLTWSKGTVLQAQGKDLTVPNW